MFFPSAKIIVRHPEDDSRILLVKRTLGHNFFYEPAGGKVEIDFVHKKAETLEECIIREAKKELGLAIEIERYIGSYYFFWKIDPLKASCCALFLGRIVGNSTLSAQNADSCELPIEPVWVSLEAIRSGEIPIDDSYVGLKGILCNI